MLTWPSRTQSLRLMLAALLAPLIAILAVVLLTAAIMAGVGEIGWAEVPQYAASAWGLFVVFGAPGAYLLEGLVGIPAYYWLTGTGRFRPRWVVVCAASAGAFAFSIPWTVISGMWHPLAFLGSVAVGAAGGSVGGVAFWGIAYATPGEMRAA